MIYSDALLRAYARCHARCLAPELTPDDFAQEVQKQAVEKGQPVNFDYKVKELWHYSHRQKRDGRPIHLTVDPVAPAATDPLILRERAEAVRAAVATLPDHLRAAVKARLWDGLTFQDAAAELGLKVSTLKGHFRKALERLEVSLAGCC